MRRVFEKGKEKCDKETAQVRQRQIIPGQIREDFAKEESSGSGRNMQNLIRE